MASCPRCGQDEIDRPRPEWIQGWTGTACTACGYLHAGFGQPRARRSIPKIFILGVLVWLFGQGLLAWWPMLARDLPHEVDDSYARIIRARRMVEPFTALESIREQCAKPTQDPELAYRRHRARIELLLDYSPGYHWVLIALERVTGSWERALAILEGLGPFVMGFAIIYLGLALIGLEATGFALIILGCHMGPSQGTHYLTPWVAATTVAMIGLARLIRSDGDDTRSIFLASILAMVLHPIGKTLAIVLILAGTFGAPRCLSMPSRNRWLWLTGISVLFVTCWESTASTHLTLAQGVSWTSYANEIARSIIMSGCSVYERLKSWGGLAGLATMLAIGGAFTLETVEGAWLLIIVGAWMPVMLGSLLFILPRQPGELFARMSVIPWVIVALLIGRAFQELAKLSSGRVRELVLWLLLAESIARGCHHLRLIAGDVIQRQALELDRRHPPALVEMAGVEDVIYYNDPYSMLFCLAQGCGSRMSLYRETMDHTDLPALQDVRWVVGVHREDPESIIPEALRAQKFALRLVTRNMAVWEVL